MHVSCQHQLLDIEVARGLSILKNTQEVHYWG